MNNIIILFPMIANDQIKSHDFLKVLFHEDFSPIYKGKKVGNGVKIED